jgi:2-(1,2-epoxy-1,2-dihydrophenyl)acetyl-CoA isomerase
MESAMSSSLLVALDHGIKRITINRPERRNALDPETSRMLLDAIRWSADDGTRVIVLTGARESFCAGADLVSASSAAREGFDVTAWLRETTNPTILAMRELPIPIIARVHGPAVGVGCNLALASDLIIASEHATFAQVFVKVGLVPDGGSTYLLPHLVGYHKAFELMALGELVTAKDAHALGIVNRLVPTPALDCVVDEMAKRLAHGPATALAHLKRGLTAVDRQHLVAALDREAVSQADCIASPDFREGVSAFMEKRAAVFA